MVQTTRKGKMMETVKTMVARGWGWNSKEGEQDKQNTIFGTLKLFCMTL